MPYLLLILTTLFWSGNFVLSRGMHTEIPPIGLAFWRWMVALLILMPFGIPLILRQWTLIKKHIPFLLLQGLLGVAGFNSLIYLAMQTTTAINAVLVNSCIPLLIVIICWILYRERLRLRQAIGVSLSLAGVLLIMAKGEIATLIQLQCNRGDLLVFSAAVVWAWYSANLKKYPQGLHPLAYLCSIVLIGVGCLLPFYLLEIQADKIVQLNKGTVLSVLYLALFASVAAFIFWNKAVREVGPNRAGPFIHLMPVFSTILAILFLDETLFGYHLRGIVLVFFGILLASVPGNKPANKD